MSFVEHGSVSRTRAAVWARFRPEASQEPIILLKEGAPMRWRQVFDKYGMPLLLCAAIVYPVILEWVLALLWPARHQPLVRYLLRLLSDGHLPGPPS
jgi:hypothetical protein